MSVERNMNTYTSGLFDPGTQLRYFLSYLYTSIWTELAEVVWILFADGVECVRLASPFTPYRYASLIIKVSSFDSSHNKFSS